MGSRKLEGPPETLGALQSTGATPTFQHLPAPSAGVSLPRMCGKQVCASEGVSILAIWGMFCPSLMEGTRMQKPLSSPIFSLLFPLNLCLQRFPFLCYLPFTNVWQKPFFQEENLKACHQPLGMEGSQMGFSGERNHP